MRTTGIVVLVCVVALGAAYMLAFGDRAFNFQEEKFFAPKEEAVRRETFDQSRAHVDGIRQELSKFRYQYETAKSPDDRAAICTMVRSDLGDFDKSNLDSALREFATSCGA